MLAEVNLDFLETKSPSEKADFGDDREADIIGKPEFADIASHGLTPGALIAKGVAVRTAVTNAAGGNDVQKEALGPVVASWNREARKWAKYVTEKAQEQTDIADQLAIIVLAGFTANKVTKIAGLPSPQVTGFVMKPIIGVPGKAAIKSDSMGENTTYVSVFHRDPGALDLISWVDDQIVLPDVGGFIIHTTTDSRESEVTLSSSEKWHGTRYALNRTGRGPTSLKASAVTQ